jgi:hypothetical protein
MKEEVRRHLKDPCGAKAFYQKIQLKYLQRIEVMSI